MARFSEVVGVNTRGVDVITDDVVDLTEPVVVPARGVYILELEK